MKRGAYHFRAIPVLQPIHRTHLVCPSTCHTRACHRGRTEIFCCIYVWHSWKKKKKKKKVRLQSIIILSLQYPEKLYDYDPVQIGNAHLKRPEWTSTQEATTLWTCSNGRLLERETKPFGSEWSWCVEKLCINASDTQWRLRKKGNGHWLSLSKVSRPEPSLPERWKAIMVCSQQSQEPSIRLTVLYNHISADMFD